MRLTRRTYQWGGAAFMLGNVLFVVNKLNEMSRLFLAKWIPDVISGHDILLILTGQVALVIGFVLYFRLYAPRVGRSGKQALHLFCGGGILLALGHIVFTPLLTFDLLFILVIIGVAGMVGGLIWFGIINLRESVLGRWQWLPLLTGLMGFIGFFLFSGEEITATFLLFRTLFALGLIGIGLTMWLEKPLQADRIE